MEKSYRPVNSVTEWNCMIVARNIVARTGDTRIWATREWGHLQAFRLVTLGLELGFRRLLQTRGLELAHFMTVMRNSPTK